MLPPFKIDPSWYDRYWLSEREERRPRKRRWALAYAAIRRIVSTFRPTILDRRADTTFGSSQQDIRLVRPED